MDHPFPATSPRQPFDHHAKITAAAYTIRDRHDLPRVDRIAKSTADRTRLKLPWLTVVPCASPVMGEWGERIRVSTRLYFNRPALDVIVPDGVPRTCSISIDHDHKELLILSRKGGHPLTIVPNTASYGTQRWIADELHRKGYASDDESTYFPIHTRPYGLVADLSVAYDKAGAVAHEEDIRRRGKEFTR